MFLRALYTSSPNSRVFAILVVISVLFDVTFNVGCILSSWISIEEQLGSTLTMLVGCCLPRLENEADRLSCQERRYKSYVMRVFTKIYTLFLVFPIHGITSSYESDTFPSVSGKYSRSGSRTILGYYGILLLVETCALGIAELIFYFFEPKYGLRLMTDFRKAVGEHEIVFTLLGWHVLTVCVGNLAIVRTR